MLTQEDRERLQEVVQLIDDTHWAQGHYQHFDGEKTTYCLVGMVHEVVKERHDRTQIPRILGALRYSVSFDQPEYSTLEGWNDHPSRTKEEVRELVLRTMTQTNS